MSESKIKNMILHIANACNISNFEAKRLLLANAKKNCNNTLVEELQAYKY